MITKLQTYGWFNVGILFLTISLGTNCKKLYNTNNECSYDFDPGKVTAEATVGTYNWKATYDKSFMSSNISAYKIKCAPKSDSLSFSLLGNINNTKTSYLNFECILNGTTIRRFSDLVLLDYRSFVLDDKINYILLHHYRKDGVLNDTISNTIKISEGKLTFSRSFVTCTANYHISSSEESRSIRTYGKFNFNIPNGTEKIPVNGTFDFLLNPLSDDINFKN